MFCPFLEDQNYTFNPSYFPGSGQSDLVASGQIIPIIEPVNISRSNLLSIDHYRANNLRFGLICNPRVGSPRVLSQADVAATYASRLTGYNNYHPCLYVNNQTLPADIVRFRRSLANLSPIFIFDGETLPAISAALRAIPNCAYFVFIEDRTSQAFRQTFDPVRSVPLRDVFARQARNADYPPQEIFSDRNHLLPNFADYSIVGDDFFEGGGAAHAVTLHHIYYSAARGSTLHVRHFISDRTIGASDSAGKFLEALRKLVAALPALGAHNLTATCDEYRNLLARRHFPGLATAKKLAIQHHLELLM